MKKKNILLINNSYPTEMFPKRGAYIKSVEECLLAANLKVDKLTLNSSYRSKVEKFINYIKFYKELFFFKDYSKYKYVYIHHFPYVFLPLIRHLKKINNRVINFHGDDIFYSKKISKALNTLSYFFLVKGDTYISPSIYFKNKIMQTIPKLRKSVFIISPSGGVDTDVFKPLKRINKEKKDKLRIGFASGFNISKGIEDVLFLIKNLNHIQFELHVIDYGPQRDMFFNELKKCPNVIFHKPYLKHLMPNFYNKIDVLFFPTKNESLGLVGLEAMACDVPVIGPDDFELRRYIKNGISGEKYTQNTREYISCFDKLVKNKGVYNPRKEVLRYYSKNYVINQFKEIFV